VASRGAVGGGGACGAILGRRRRGRLDLGAPHGETSLRRVESAGRRRWPTMLLSTGGCETGHRPGEIDRGPPTETARCFSGNEPIVALFCGRRRSGLAR